LTASRVAIVTDSTADLPAGLALEREITIVPLTVTVDGRDYLDGVQITPERFYPLLAASGRPATTSQPAPARFEESYLRLLESHDSIVSLHISSKLSGTYAAALQAAQAVGDERVAVVDSELASVALGLMTLAAAEMAARGADPATIAGELDEVRTSMHTVFTVSTLEYLRRGGRIGRASALVGSVLQVKPVLTLESGEVSPLERVRTYDRALSRMVELTTGVDRGHGICAAVAHAVNGDVASRLADSIADRSESLLIQSLGPVVGAHTGPGAMAIACYPSEVFPLGLGRPEAPASVA
jgi:DegV family protein with EDD domain